MLISAVEIIKTEMTFESLGVFNLIMISFFYTSLEQCIWI